ncbi:MAG: PHP domain-containing protein [Clostridia bacterium]|nr:PHP domain-containing protein [Clostridia bacterium]
MFRYETHCHTKEASRCGKLSGADVARMYKDLGYDGIFITDHFFNGSSAVDPSLPWEEKVAVYLSGFENAKAEGEKIGLDVFLGIEFWFYATEFLVYGPDRAFLLANPDLDRLDMRELLTRCREQGYFCVHAHPFRQRGYIKTLRLYPDLTDAVETLNAAHPETDHFVFDRRAQAYADSYGLPFTGGSDCHVPDQRWMGGILCEERIACWQDYAAAVKTRRVAPFREPHDRTKPMKFD